jgi:hypothetical protein
VCARGSHLIPYLPTRFNAASPPASPAAAAPTAISGSFAAGAAVVIALPAALVPAAADFPASAAFAAAPAGALARRALEREPVACERRPLLVVERRVFPRVRLAEPLRLLELLVCRA